MSKVVLIKKVEREFMTFIKIFIIGFLSFYILSKILNNMPQPEMLIFKKIDNAVFGVIEEIFVQIISWL